MRNQLLTISITAATLLLGSISLPAQNFDWDGVPNQHSYTMHFENGMAINAGDFDIGIDVDDPDDLNDGFTWAYCTTESGCGTPSHTNFTAGTQVVLNDLRGGGGQLWVTWPSAGVPLLNVTTPEVGGVRQNAASGEYYIEIRLLEGTNGSFLYKKFYFVVRNALEMVFVLDRSGSMECAFDNYSWPGCIIPCNPIPPAGCGRRWDLLVDGIDQFIQKMDRDTFSGLLSSDRFSVVYFSGVAATSADFTLGGLDVLTLHSNLLSGLKTNMTTSDVAIPELARDGTSVGAGLMEVIDNRFSALPNRRRVILFITDGEQNRAPKLKVNAAKQLWIDQDDMDDVFNGAGGDVNFSSTSYNVFAVGIGEIPAMANLLADIQATGNGALFLVAPSSPTPSVPDLLGEAAFNEVHSEFSPVHIKFEMQDLQTENRAVYQVNDNVRRLFFEANFQEPVARSYEYRVEKDGVDVTGTEMANLKVGQYYATFTFDFEKIMALDSKGEWTFICQPGNFDDVLLYDRGEMTEGPPARVRLSATADDHSVDVDFFTDSAIPRVGDKLKPSVRLRVNGIPVEGAVVRATIFKPGDDLNDILARSDAPWQSNPEPDAGGCSTQKLTYLLQNNPEALEEYFNISQDPAMLSHRGNGLYTGEYDGLDVAGVYQIIYTVQANTPIGVVERMKQQTVNVRFGSVDINLFDRKISSGDNRTRLSFAPAYVSNGKIRYVGPGLEYGLSVEGEGISQARAQDDCNGMYQVAFTTDGNPKIKMKLFGDEFYSGRANNFDKPYYKYPAGISLHGGITYPLEELDSLYDGNFFLEADLGYQFHPYFSLEGAVGYYAFTNSFNIIGASIYAKGQFKLSQANLFAAVAAGGGYYFPKQEASSAGFNLRGSVIRRMNMRWDISIEAAYFRMVDAKEHAWGTLGAGVKYRF